MLGTPFSELLMSSIVVIIFVCACGDFFIDAGFRVTDSGIVCKLSVAVLVYISAKIWQILSRPCSLNLNTAELFPEWMICAFFVFVVPAYLRLISWRLI